MLSETLNLRNSNMVARHYDELDSLYRSIWGPQLHHGLWEDSKTPTLEKAVIRMTDYLADKGELREGMELLDVGCGYGATAFYLAQKYQLSVLGISLSKQQIDFAKTQYLGPRIDFMMGDFLQSAFLHNHYDRIWASECLSHMPSAEIFFAKCYETLRPGGRLVLAAWQSTEQPSTWATDHLLNPICKEGRLYRLLSHSQCRKLMEAAGFKLLHYEDLSKKVQRTWKVAGLASIRHFINQPKDLAMLFNKNNSNANFALSLLRIPLAYHLGVMKYGAYVAEKR